MKLITKEIEKQLRSNMDIPETDRKPYLKLFGGSSATWLISEIESGSIEEGNAIFFGLCDLGAGYPEMGSVAMQDLASVKFPPFDLPIERDLYFTPNKTLMEYWEDSRTRGAIVA